MGLVSGSLSSLINGVSQQPSWMRLASQGEAQENAMSSLVYGVQRRPPREHIARISATSFGNAFLHTINRDATKRFEVIVTNGDLKVFDLNGVEQTVNFPNGKGYLTNADPKNGFACTTLADFTFVVNKSINVTETSLGLTTPNYVFAHIKQAAFNSAYGIYLDGSLAASMTTAATGNAPQTNAIAADLATSLGATVGTTYWCNAYANVLQIGRWDGAPLNIGSYDSAGDSLMVTFGKSIQNFVDLPVKNAPAGTVVKVVGAASKNNDGYWVTFDGTAWIETAQPEAQKHPTYTTMPWKLVQEIDGTWTFSPITWANRTAGDLNTAPAPSIIGRTINDIIVHRNRLFILADQNVVASRSGGSHFFELYASTVTALLDTDPIDVGLSTDITAVPIAKFAIPFAEDLMIWTEPAQFKIGTGDQALTAATVKAAQIASYPTSLQAKPSVNGKFVHFAIEKGGNSGLREGVIDNRALVFEAPDVSVHVPSYVKGKITRICAAANRDAEFILADGSVNTVWVYKWYVENDTKMQSSWSKWVFPSTDTILDIAYMDSVLYMIVERPTGVYLERVRLDESFTDTGLDFEVRLDRKVAVAGTYDAGTKLTTFTIPYDLTGLTPIGVFGGMFAGKVGFEMPVATVVDAAAGTITVPGDRSAGTCFFGVRYESLYTLSTISVSTPSPDGKGKTPITDGRLQLRNIFVNYGNAGYFQVVVSSPGRQTFTYTFQPNKLGQTLVVGRRILQSGRFRVPVHAKNTDVTITIKSDSHYPCDLLSIDWEGEFTLRSRRT